MLYVKIYIIILKRYQITTKIVFLAQKLNKTNVKHTKVNHGK